MPTCEICGRETLSTQEISLEGARLQACSRCAKLGEPIHKPTPSAPQYSTSVPTSQKRPTLHPPRSTPSRPRQIERELVPVEDFSRLIRNAREEQGLSQKDIANKIYERTSIIAKLEGGKMSPTIALARKLERLFKLTLLEEAESVDLPSISPSSSTTLGDVVEVRRKRKPSSVEREK
ncbi:MAG: multiprotein bridging factor aMBF1 [Promethearchaeota archaeon]